MKLGQVFNFLVLISNMVEAQLCGVIFNRLSRVVGGNSVQEINYPWFVAFAELPLEYFYSKNIQCGGSLITQRDVLTAAHCMETTDILPEEKFVALIGINNICGKFSPSYKVFEIQHVRIHPLYLKSDTNFEYDIAVVSLRRRTNSIPICLPRFTEYRLKYGTVIGFGSLTYNGKIPCHLQSVVIHTFSRTVCKSVWNDLLPESAFCAGVPEGGRDACQGDSGGPYFGNKGNRLYTIYGLVSFGRNCGLPNTPGVYTDIRYFVYWISNSTVEKTVQS